MNKSFLFYKDLIKHVEANYFLKSKFKCEVFLSKRLLYPSKIEKYKNYKDLSNLTNLLSYCDGLTSIYQIMNKCNLKMKKIKEIEKKLYRFNLILKKDIPF